MAVPVGLDDAWAWVRRLPSALADVALGVAFLVAGLWSTTSTENGSALAYERRTAVAYLLIVGATAPYFVRRRAPLPVFLFATGSLGVLSLRGYNEGVLPLVALVGAYTVAAHRSAREALVAGAATAVVLLGLLAGDSRGFDVGDMVFNATLFGTAFLLGRNVHARRRHLLALEQGQLAATVQAATDERLRIAQEMHDVVAHSLGVIAVQAGVGLHVLDSDPSEARRSLEHISTTSRTSLEEIRRLLGVVRTTGEGSANAPTPDIDAIPRLVHDVEAAGLRVELSIGDEVRHLPPGVGLAVYRIVQESLTNALRHARASLATVRVDDVDGEVVIEVRDDGRGPAPNRKPSGLPGHGRVGMRERAALYGGSVDAGPGADGGFRVLATLLPRKEPIG